MDDLGKAGCRLRSDPETWAVAAHQVRKGRFDGGIALHQRIVIRVRDLGRVFLVIGLAVVGDGFCQPRQFSGGVRLCNGQRIIHACCHITQKGREKPPALSQLKLAQRSSADPSTPSASAPLTARRPKSRAEQRSAPVRPPPSRHPHAPRNRGNRCRTRCPTGRRGLQGTCPWRCAPENGTFFATAP